MSPYMGTEGKVEFREGRRLSEDLVLAACVAGCPEKNLKPQCVFLVCGGGLGLPH